MVLHNACHTAQSFHFQREIVRINLPIIIIMYLKLSQPPPQWFHQQLPWIYFCASPWKDRWDPKIKLQAVVTFSDTHPELRTIVQTQHYSRNRNLPIAKSEDKLIFDIQETWRRTPNLRRGKSKTAMCKNCQAERLRRQEVVRNHGRELVSPGEILRDIFVKIQFCWSESF